MGLDLAKTIAQLDAVALGLQAGQEDRQERLSELLRTMRQADADEVRARVESSQGRPFLAAGVVEELAGKYQPVQVLDDFCVASVDGSHIDVDRHLPVRCYLINLGGCALTYGTGPDARLYSRPRVYSTDEELYITGPSSGATEEVPLEGALVGFRRAVQEVEELASLVAEMPSDLPVLALIDGSLVLWGLSGRGYQAFVREEFILRGLVPALDRLRALASSRPVALAAYVSLPRSTEVVHTLRLLLCQKDTESCCSTCSMYRSRQEPCDTANGFLDRELFAVLLEKGERSCLFETSSSISRDFYGPHRVYFYYLHVGEEIARVEVPQWVAQDQELLALSHSLVLDQCRRGGGYPAAIVEAHEQAVLTGSDRESFRSMIEDALGRRRLPVYTSEKNRSKRVPWV